MSLTIRPATLGDIPTITRVYAQAVAQGTASFEYLPPDEAEMTRRMQALLARGLPYFVAELDGTVAGYAYAGPYHGRPGYRFTLEDSIYIAPDSQRRGIGGMLLTALIETAEAKGFRQMVSVIGDSDNVGSIALHAAHGFQYVGTLKNVGFKFGRWLDSVLMQRPLGPGASAVPED
ncbi:MAG: GNAT family N-acetyltransferase [Pseudolabrys sp.]|jgi:L-amino acid N-acyltransferase YncA